MIYYINKAIAKITSILRRWSFTGKYVDIVLHDKDINELAKGTSIATFFKVLSLPLGLATSLIISRWYGADSMGLYGLIVTISGLAVSIGLLGLGTAMPRFLGESKAKKTGDEQAIYRSSLRLIFLSGIIISVLLYLTAGWLSYTVFDEPRLYFAVQITALFIFPIMWYRLNSEFLLGSKKIWHSELITKGLVPIAMLTFVFLSYWIWPTYYVPIWAYLITSASGVIISLYILWKNKYVAVRGPTVSSKKILRVSIPMVITSMAGMIAKKTDILMLGWLGSTSEVGVYQVVFGLVVLIPLGLQLFGVVIKPKIAELFWAEKKHELQKVISISAMGITIIALGGLAFFQLFPEFILGLWGAEFIEGVSALRILSIGFLVHALCGNNGLYMNATGKQNIMQKIILGVALINFVLNYFLIPKYGIQGAAFASMVTMIIQNIIISGYAWKVDKVRTFIWFSKKG